MKKMSRRKITSVIDDMEKVSSDWKFRFNAIPQAGSLRRSMNSIVFISSEFITRFTRATR